MGTTSSSSSSLSPLPVNNNLEQNHLFSSSPLSVLSPKSISSIPMDNNHLTPTMQSSLYSPSNYYPHQRTSPSGYRSFDSSNRNQPLSHESHPPLFDEFLTPPPSSSSYLPMTNTSLSIHSHMNVSFQETTTNPSNPSMMTPANSFNHHPTMYPY